MTPIAAVRAFAFVGLCFGSHTLARQPAFHEIGVLPGAQTSWVTDISGTGGTAVGSCYTTGLAGRTFSWTAAGGMVEIQGSVAGQFIAPRSISADGTCIVGLMASPSGSSPFRWTASTGASLLSPLNGLANGVSHDGSVVVGFFGQYPSERTFRWTAGGIIDIGRPQGWASAWSAGVSHDGITIAGSGNSPAGGRAFTWSPVSGFQVIGTTETTLAYGISGDGLTVVGEVGPGNSHRAFRWTAANGLDELGVPSGYWRARATGASFNADVIIGYAEDFTPPSPRTLSWVWTQSHGFRDIHSVLEGVLPPGWTELHVLSVSADGLTFGGGGMLNGTTRGWVATIPQPAGVLILALATPSILARRRHHRGSQDHLASRIR